MSQISEIYIISVDNNDFEYDFTEIMELNASDIHNRTAFFIWKYYYDELNNFMDGFCTNKELDEIKMILNDEITCFKKKTLASKTITNIDRRTSKLLSVSVNQSKKQKCPMLKIGRRKTCLF